MGAVTLTVVGALALSGCTDWRDRVEAGLAIREPEQVAITDTAPTRFTFPDDRVATLTPRARYRTKAWVVAVDRAFDDGAEDVLGLDVGLVWGPVANRDILRSMRFHLARRYLSARWDGEMPLANDVVMRHLSNHHLVVPDPELRAYLDHVAPGDLLTLEGALVDVALEGEGARIIRSSLRRDDVGNGACEVLWVERAEIERPWQRP